MAESRGVSVETVALASMPQDGIHVTTLLNADPWHLACFLEAQALELTPQELRQLTTCSRERR